MGSIKVVELFAGVGGFRLGLEQTKNRIFDLDMEIHQQSCRLPSQPFPHLKFLQYLYSHVYLYQISYYNNQKHVVLYVKAPTDLPN